MVDYKEELKELSERIEKLEAFLLTDTFDKLENIDAKLLISQYMAMKDYMHALEARVKRL